MNKVYIIAEAGVNHNGKIDMAYQLIDVAIEAGADAIKFQTFKAEHSISKYAPKANYQYETTNKLESQYDMIKKLELSANDHKGLNSYCTNKNISFLSTPFDLHSINILNNLGLQTFKIPSGEIINLPYLEAIGRLNKKVLMSTGMANLGEIEDALEILIKFGTKKKNITILHVNTEYPTPMKDVNLKAMLTIKEAFKVNVGYSDHTLGIEIPIAAVGLGATVLEKHFTLDRSLPGPDHKASLEPEELKTMIRAIRNVELALSGSGIKEPSKSEFKNIRIARKSIVAARPISKGETFTSVNLAVKRPGTGINPMLWGEIIGKKAIRNFAEDELIKV